MSKRRGFTLIELLVVISIIGMLSAIVLASMSSARVKANDTKRLADFRQIQTALELYYSTYGSYPGSNETWYDINPCSTSYTDFSAVMSTTFLPQVPKDPISGRCTWYWNKRSGQGYMIMFMPEQSSLLTSGGNMGCYDPSSWYCMGVNW